MEIYADYAATTPVKPEVVDAMMMIYNSHYGNPSSIHAKGRDARKYLDESRRQITEYLVQIHMKLYLRVVQQNRIIRQLKA